MFHDLRASATPRRRFAALLVAAGALSIGSPAAAQYGGAVDLFVDPTRVEVDGGFDYFGSSCPAGSAVTITIDGFPGIIDTTTAFDDSSYGGSGIDVPGEVIAGQDYTVRAACAGGSDIAVVRAVCAGGDDPVDGECPGGGIVGVDPTTTTVPSSTVPSSTVPGSGVPSSTVPGSGGTTVPPSTTDPGSDGSGAGGGDDDGSGGSTTGTGGDNGVTITPDLAVTGAGFVEQTVQVGITLVALGAILMLLTGRRRDRRVA